MSAVVQSNILQLRPCNNEASKPRPSPGFTGQERESNRAAFPAASTPSDLPLMMRDEILDLYAFVFCQRGYRQLGLTFEQFLIVAAAFTPNDLHTSWKLPSKC
jgi:hypothetical protein